jgi:hypothetical protein
MLLAASMPASATACGGSNCNRLSRNLRCSSILSCCLLVLGWHFIPKYGVALWLTAQAAAALHVLLQ